MWGALVRQSFCIELVLHRRFAIDQDRICTVLCSRSEPVRERLAQPLRCMTALLQLEASPDDQSLEVFRVDPFQYVSRLRLAAMLHIENGAREYGAPQAQFGQIGRSARRVEVGLGSHGLAS